MRRIAAAFALVCLLLPAAGAGAKAPPVFVFGLKNGSKEPFEASIGANGVVSASGGIRRLGPVTLSRPALNGLLRLARAAGFYSLPKQIRCPNQPGSLATLYIHIHTSKYDKTVYEYGGCRPAFDELFELLKAAAALQ